MSRNQYRIEGDYSIVSVYTTGHTQAENVARHKAAIEVTLALGYGVQLLCGRWNGAYERSIKITGKAHAQRAALIAFVYGQDAYIVVQNGVATLHDKLGQNIVWTREVPIDTTVGADNYSETYQGYTWRFEP